MTLLGLSIVSIPANGTVELSDTTIGCLTYTPDTDFCGTDTFSLQACDDAGNCQLIDVSIFVDCDTIADPNLDAIDDNVSTPEETPITIGVLANDIFPDTLYTIDLVTDPANGTAVVVGNSILYTPDTDFVGIDLFQYVLCATIDLVEVCDTATVFINVTEGEPPLECEPVFANIFTPNGDGINDQFLIENADDLVECFPTETIQPQLLIFNRWGDLVFQSDNYTNDQAWDGRWMNTGNELPDGTYFYVFRLTEDADKDRTYQGYVEVRR